MNRFFRTFFGEPVRGVEDIVVFGFGKHPGWDDHIEGIGLHNDTLATAHSYLYFKGIRGIIDAGTWEKAESIQVIREFGNAFIWQGQGKFMIGRMWPSIDGKGRSKYPMIIGVWGGGFDLTEILTEVDTRLASMENECRAAKTADEVRAILERGEKSIRDALKDRPQVLPVPEMTGEDYRKLVAVGDFSHGDEGWLRVFYSFHNQLGPFMRGAFHLKTADELGGRHIRLPLIRGPGIEGMLDWLRLLRAELDPHVPIFLAMHHDKPWCDVIAGEPDFHDFICLKMNLEALPYASEIPYNIPEHFRERADAILEAWKTGEERGLSELVRGGSPAGGRESPETRGAKGFLKNLFGLK